MASDQNNIFNETYIYINILHWHTRRVKEAIHIRLHPNNINRDTGIEIPEEWLPTIKKHTNKRAAKKRTAERTTHQNSEDRNAPTTAEHSAL